MKAFSKENDFQQKYPEEISNYKITKYTPEDNFQSHEDPEEGDVDEKKVIE